MNNSNAAAKARRAGIKPTNPAVPSQNTMADNGDAQLKNQSGLTLPQVISVIDHRLITLETFMKETKENPIVRAATMPNKEGTTTGTDEDADIGFIVPSEFNSFVDEINNRFQILAEEIEVIKNTLIKLQSFSMDVNKAILEKMNIILPSLEDKTQETAELENIVIETSSD